MENIRLALQADVPRIVEMGSRSLKEGPYAGKISDVPEQTARFALQVINEKGKILVAEKDGQLIGLFGFILYDHPFTGERTGYEMMWWTEPEHRQSFTAIALLRAAQREAKAMGAVTMQCGAPNETVGRAYESLGFEKIEVSYQKDLIH